MKITYTYTPLGEDTAIPALICPGDAENGSPDNWIPQAEGVLQPAGYPGAQEIEMFPRGNTIIQRQFTVHRTFGSRAEAIGYWMDQEKLPGTDGILTMQNEGNSGGLWTARAGCQRAQVIADIGVTLIISYLFIGPRSVKGPASNLIPIIN